MGNMKKLTELPEASQNTLELDKTNIESIDDDTKANPSEPQFLSIDEQERLALEVNHVAEKSPLKDKCCYSYAPYMSIVATLPLSYNTWRAGFRGYGLSKYGRSRTMSAFMAFVYPMYGGIAVSVFGSDKLMSPFRKENPWHHGLRYALSHTIGVFIVTTSNIVLLFTIANRSGLLPIPDGLHKPSVRQIASQVLLSRVKPYRSSIIVSATLSTIFMYAVGVCSYYQSCSLLNKIDRHSLIHQRSR